MSHPFAFRYASSMARLISTTTSFTDGWPLICNRMRSRPRVLVTITCSEMRSPLPQAFVSFFVTTLSTFFYLPRTSYSSVMDPNSIPVPDAAQQAARVLWVQNSGVMLWALVQCRNRLRCFHAACLPCLKSTV
jgi:hypothetical protein